MKKLIVVLALTLSLSASDRICKNYFIKEKKSFIESQLFLENKDYFNAKIAKQTNSFYIIKILANCDITPNRDKAFRDLLKNNTEMIKNLDIWIYSK